MVALKNVAKLLQGLATSILKETLPRVENKRISLYQLSDTEQNFYLTFSQDSAGDLFIDAEMVFQISPTGRLQTLTPTAISDLL